MVVHPNGYWSYAAHGFSPFVWHVRSAGENARQKESAMLPQASGAANLLSLLFAQHLFQESRAASGTADSHAAARRWPGPDRLGRLAPAQVWPDACDPAPHRG